MYAPSSLSQGRSRHKPDDNRAAGPRTRKLRLTIERQLSGQGRATCHEVVAISAVVAIYCA